MACSRRIFLFKTQLICILHLTFSLNWDFPFTWLDNIGFSIRHLRSYRIHLEISTWKSVMLRNKRDEFDKEIKCLEEKVKEPRALVEENLQKEIDASTHPLECKIRGQLQLTVHAQATRTCRYFLWFCLLVLHRLLRAQSSQYLWR